MFIGALPRAVAGARRGRRSHEKYTVPVASGIIAGESLMGVVIAFLIIFKLLAVIRGAPVTRTARRPGRTSRALPCPPSVHQKPDLIRRSDFPLSPIS